jgi:hypothetical protein
MGLLVHSHTSGWEKGSIVSEEVVGKSPDYHALQNFLEKIYWSLSKYPYPHIYQSFFYNMLYILWDVKWCWGHLGRLFTFEFMVCSIRLCNYAKVETSVEAKCPSKSPLLLVEDVEGFCGNSGSYETTTH